jgi:Putative MetA-pathway of phenol degradation
VYGLASASLRACALADYKKAISRNTAAPASALEGTQMTSKLSKLAAASLLSLCASTPTALAGSVTQPGETVGAAAGAAPPPGFYLINTFDWGHRTGVDVDVGVTIPVGVWSTPWTILGGRLIFLVATPAVQVNPPIGPNQFDIYNPLISGMLAWDLGNGFNFSYLLGAYLEMHTPVAWSSTSLNQRFALTYNAGGWNLTANLIWGIQFNDVTGRPQLSPCPAPFGFNGCNPDFLNLDLTATKKFGRWEIGAVGFGSTDLNRPIPTYLKQSQFALGGLIGYDFGPLSMQAYVTTDVVENNYGGRDTRGWWRVILPLGNPFATAPAPIARRY